MKREPIKPKVVLTLSETASTDWTLAFLSVLEAEKRLAPRQVSEDEEQSMQDSGSRSD